MKVTELNNLINDIVTKEVKKHIIKESEENKKEVYHIKCDGEPVATFKSEEEAHQHLDVYKKNHPGKQFIIEKGTYDSHDHMLDELDAMGEKLEKMENQKSMEEMLKGNQKNIDKNDNGEIDKQDFEILRGQQDEEYGCESCDQGDPIWEEDVLGTNEGVQVCDECSGMLDEENQCTECGKMHGFEEHGEDGDDQHHHLPTEDQSVHEAQMCNECGGMMDENNQCNECGYMMESKKKRSIRLSETEMVKLIKKIVKESTPGIPGVAITKRNHERSGKENEDHIKATEKKMKDYLSFDGNDNSEFPHQNGVNDKKMARTNSEEQDEEVKRNFAGLENLEYDVEPSEGFKKRLKMAIEGHPKMGNGSSTEKPSIKPSNGAEKGKEAKEKEGNHIKTPETAKTMEKQMKNREEDKKKRVLYPKEAVPVNESKVSFSSVLLEEMNKMKKLTSYNKKTQ